MQRQCILFVHLRRLLTFCIIFNQFFVKSLQ